jgi:TRAP-type C4-dicarboxylate transport system substrate-binding protein
VGRIKINTRLVASGLFAEYDEFFVVGSFATEAESIHTRPPIASLDDLKGLRIRANNPIEASVLVKLGMHAVVLPIGKTAEAISRGTIDGAATATVPLIDFGLGRVFTYHYYLRLGASVRSILMDRGKFEDLPPAGRDVIRKYGGEWLAKRFIAKNEPYNAELLEKLKSDPLRKVIFPSQPEIDVAEEAFRAVRGEWADISPHRRELLDATQAEILRFRSERLEPAAP